MFDHVTLTVSDLAESKRFYDLALRVLPFGDDAHESELGVEWGDFAIAPASADRPITQHLHVAFAAADNATVDEFWRVLTNAGYRDNGAPGERPEYHAGYYGAFVLDPDGHNVEAVCHNRN